MISKSEWTTIFSNNELTIEKDEKGNYRISFIEDSFEKEEFLYTKEKSSEKDLDIKTTNIKHEENTQTTLEKILKEYKPYKAPEAYFDNTTKSEYIPKCCRNCSNHPSNGGSGICACTAPLYDDMYPWKVTCNNTVTTTGKTPSLTNIVQD